MTGEKNSAIFYTSLSSILLLLFIVSLVYGSVSIPLSTILDILSGKETGNNAWEQIVLQSRIPQAITAIMAGASLAVSGLLLQTLFRNPLAGPSILGISDGANLGVAAIMLYFGGSLSNITDYPISGYITVILANTDLYSSVLESFTVVLRLPSAYSSSSASLDEV